MIRTISAPAILVAIGEQSRMYCAYITSAPVLCDAPSTLTLLVDRLAEIARLAANDLPLETARPCVLARLVLVDVAELDWQRARCREAGHFMTSADGGLINPNALQHWLWQRLQRPTEPRVGARSA